MIGEVPTPHPDNTNELFDALMSREWENEPNLRESIDAGVKRVLMQAAQLEESLNLTPHEGDDVEALLQVLNGDWDDLGYEGYALNITGKLQPTPYALEQDVEELVALDAFVGISKVSTSDQDPHYTATHAALLVRGFGVEKVKKGNRHKYRTTLRFGLDEDYGDDETWFTAFPEDLEYVDVPYPSREGAATFIYQNFPALFGKINALPADCHDGELIRQTLGSFVARFDVTKTDSTLSSEEVLDIIETYITDRLAFDNAPYAIGVRGPIYGRTQTFHYLPADYDGELAEVLVGGIRLLAEDGPSQDGATYRPALEVWYLVPGSSQGRTAITIPIDSVTKIIEQRPPASAFPFDVFNLAVESDQEFEQSFAVASLGEAALTLSEVGSSQEGEYDSDDSEEESAIEVLTRFHHELRVLGEVVKPYLAANGVYYRTEEEVRSVYADVHERVQSFLTRWSPLISIAEIQASGEALRTPTTTVRRKVDTDEQTVVLTFSGMDMSKGDLLTVRRGILRSGYVDVVEMGEEDSDDRYGIRAILEFTDTTTSPADMAISDPYFNRLMVSARIAKQFYVDLGSPVEYAMLELENEHRRREQLKKLESTQVSPAVRGKIVDRLEHIKTALENEASGTFTEYDGLEAMQELAAGLVNDAEAMRTVAIALEATLRTGRPLRLSGPMFNQLGELVTDTTLIARLEAVISEHPYLTSPQLALSAIVPEQNDGDTNERYIVPLSSLEGFAY